MKRQMPLSDRLAASPLAQRLLDYASIGVSAGWGAWFLYEAYRIVTDTTHRAAVIADPAQLLWLLVAAVAAAVLFWLAHIGPRPPR